jgi:hypothetical protein
LTHLRFTLDSKGGFTGVETLWIYYNASVSWLNRNLKRLIDRMARLAITLAITFAITIAIAIANNKGR